MPQLPPTPSGAPSPQPPPLLSEDQVKAALARLAKLWPNQPMAPEVRETWERLLPRLRYGEFTPALDDWVAGEHGRWRPAPGEFLAVVRSHRAAASHERAVRDTEQFLAAIRMAPLPPAEQSRRWLAWCRSLLQGAPDEPPTETSLPW